LIAGRNSSRAAVRWDATSLAPVEVARNTSTVAEGDSMDDDQLATEMAAVKDKLGEFPEDDKKLSKIERKEKDLLLMKQEVLARIREARNNNHKQAEFDNTVYYGVLNSWFGRHPLLRRFIINSRCRWNVF
jgi:hypothetical protein